MTTNKDIQTRLSASPRARAKRVVIVGGDGLRSTIRDFIIRDVTKQNIDFPQKSTMMQNKRQGVGYALGMRKGFQDALV